MAPRSTAVLAERFDGLAVEDLRVILDALDGPPLTHLGEHSELRMLSEMR